MTSVFGGRRPPPLARRVLPLAEAIVDAARAGLGVAALSEWIAAPYLDRTLIAKRMRRPLRRGWRIAFRPDASSRPRSPARRRGCTRERQRPRVAAYPGSLTRVG